MEVGHRVKDIAERQDKAQEQIDLLIQSTLGLNAIIGDFTKRQTESEQRMKELDQKMMELAEAQARTDERLNAFIVTVERYLSEGRNGKNGKS